MQAIDSQVSAGDSTQEFLAPRPIFVPQNHCLKKEDIAANDLKGFHEVFLGDVF